VEDAIIAAHAGAPPPEYGNTRGSVLLLNSLHTNANNGSGSGAGGQAAPQNRLASYTSRWDGIPYVAEGVLSSGSSTRGPSRHGQRPGTRDGDEDGDDHDNDHGIANNGHRALRLEEMLAALEGPSYLPERAGTTGRSRSPNGPDENGGSRHKSSQEDWRTIGRSVTAPPATILRD
jgi:hypothetical protein